ncbi:MAG: hypothetical protein OK456_04795 [Thaumarchaeota archaeon]|nr:hypothetical protein [Nitrososphaerota archaeon]
MTSVASRVVAFFMLALLSSSGVALVLPFQGAAAVTSASSHLVIRSTPPPLPDVEGCYTNTKLAATGQYGGWKSVPCATPQQLANLQHPNEGNGNSPGIDGIQSEPKLVLPHITITPQLQSGFVGVWELPNFVSETDTRQGSGFYSIQLNTNEFAGSNGHTDAVQFTIQTIPGYDTFVCVWNNYPGGNSYSKTCVTASWTGASWPLGDCGSCAAVIYGTVVPGTSNRQGFRPTVLQAQAEMPWVGSTLYGVVAGDSYGLQKNWLAGSGTILGQGGSSGAVFSATDLSDPVTITQVTTSTCPQKTFWNCSIILAQHGGLIDSGVTLEYNNLDPVGVFGPNGGTLPIGTVCFEDGCYIQFASVILPPVSSGIHGDVVNLP